MTSKNCWYDFQRRKCNANKPNGKIWITACSFFLTRSPLPSRGDFTAFTASLNYEAKLSLAFFCSRECYWRSGLAWRQKVIHSFVSQAKGAIQSREWEFAYTLFPSRGIDAAWKRRLILTFATVYVAIFLPSWTLAFLAFQSFAISSFPAYRNRLPFSAV